MKKIYRSIIACYLLFQLPAHSIHAQEQVQGLKQKLDITVNELGDAIIEVTMKLNASQWDYFKRNSGNNTANIKRDIEKALPKYFLSDFAYSEDQMERMYTVKLKAAGLCMMNKNGSWEAKLEMKNPDITKLSDREFVMNEDIMTNGVLVQQTQKLHLPSNASGAKVEKDSFGNAVLTYTTGMSWGHKLVNYAGIFMIVGGIGFFFRGSLFKKKTVMS